MRQSPNFRRVPRGRLHCEQRLRTLTALASRGIFCNFKTASSTASMLEAGLLISLFNSVRRSAYCPTIFLRLSFFATLLVFAIYCILALGLRVSKLIFSTLNLNFEILNYCLNGIPIAFKSARDCSSVFAVVTIEIFIPRILSTLLKSISGKINCSRIPSV